MYEYKQFFNNEGNTLEEELKYCILNYYNKYIMQFSK